MNSGGRHDSQHILNFPAAPVLCGRLTMGTRFVLNATCLLFLIYGIGGLAIPQLFGTHFSPQRCAMLLLLSALTIPFLATRKLLPQRIFAGLLAAIFGYLAAAGFLLGTRGHRTLIPEMEDTRLWSLHPGALEFGRNDHVIHLLLGAAFLWAAIAPERLHPPEPTTTRKPEP